MDARITKKRLNDLLSYDWIKIIALVAAAILAWSLIFTMAGVRVSAGQNFKIYLASDVTYGDSFDDYMKRLSEDVLSFDILELGQESLMPDTQATILSARLSVYEGDLVFVTNPQGEEGDENITVSNFKSFVDNYSIYSIDELISDAEEYINKFYNIENGKIKLNSSGGGDFKILFLKEYFDSRMKKDNRFKTKNQYEQGYLLEMARLETLRLAIAEFKEMISLDSKLLVSYARGEQYHAQNELEPEEPLIAKPYGINLSGVKNMASIAKGADGSVENLTLAVFNFKNKQKDLQYEVIPAIVELLKGI